MREIMNITTLVIKEIAHRPYQFLVGVAAVAAAVTGLGVAVDSLRSLDRETEHILEAQRLATAQEMARLEDEVRKSMKGLGFNIHIFPEGQELAEVYAQGYASKTMPESHATKLANSDIAVINHLLPSLTVKTKWPERGRTILIVGVKGEIPQKHRGGKVMEPLLNPVPAGHAVVGHELRQSLDIKQGQRITFMGKEFDVDRCEDERGNVDDITIWLHLEDVQGLLGKEGQINSILALECNCATVDRLGEVRREIARILPGVEVIELKSNALARAEARVQAAKTAEAQSRQIAIDRTKLKQGREKTSAISVSILAAVCAAWIAYLTHLNVIQRKQEIGTLLAIGVNRLSILLLFLLKAAAIGLVGAVAGWLLALAVAAVRHTHAAGIPVLALLNLKEAMVTAFAATTLSCAAAWLPAIQASTRDPADILRD